MPAIRVETRRERSIMHACMQAVHSLPRTASAHSQESRQPTDVVQRVLRLLHRHFVRLNCMVNVITSIATVLVIRFYHHFFPRLRLPAAVRTRVQVGLGRGGVTGGSPLPLPMIIRHKRKCSHTCL